MATLAQTTNLLIQIVLFFMVGVGSYFAFRKKKFAQHAQIMAIAWGITVASFLLVMVPSLSISAGTLLTPPLTTFNLASIIHIPIGAASMLLSTFLVFRYAFNSNRVSACMGKWPMRATMVAWEVSIAIGAVIYFTMTS